MSSRNDVNVVYARRSFILYNTHITLCCCIYQTYTLHAPIANEKEKI